MKEGSDGEEDRPSVILRAPSFVCTLTCYDDVLQEILPEVRLQAAEAVKDQLHQPNLVNRVCRSKTGVKVTCSQCICPSLVA